VIQTNETAACPADSRIARHLDAKVAERLAKCRDPALVAVSQRLGHSGLAVQLRAPRGSVTVNPLRPSRSTSSEREMNWQRRMCNENGCSGRGERSRTAVTDLFVPVSLPLAIKLTGVAGWVRLATA
jgi:hypothetical protein